eukprot:704438-Lingulodinium_polyedra.AAC.1
MNIAMYCATRRCSIAGCFSEPVCATRTIGARCSHAQVLAKLATTDAYDDGVADVGPGGLK